MKKITVTAKDIKTALESLTKKNYEYIYPFHVDNYNFYRSETAKVMGFYCLIRELKEAKKKENGFIKTAMGIELYLNRKLNL